MAPRICCSENKFGIDTFYLLYGKEKIFLFNQQHRNGVCKFYGGSGVPIDLALKNSRTNVDKAMRRTADKLPVYISYIEKEYEIQVLDKTKNKKRRNA